MSLWRRFRASNAEARMIRQLRERGVRSFGRLPSAEAPFLTHKRATQREDGSPIASARNDLTGSEQPLYPGSDDRS